MGSYGVIGFIIGGTFKAHHTQFSGDPCELGEQAMRFVAAHDDDKMRDIANSIVFQSEDDLVPKARKPEIAEMISCMYDEIERISPSVIPGLSDTKKILATQLLQLPLTWEGFHDSINYRFDIFGHGLNVMNDASAVLGTISQEGVALINLDARCIEVYASSDTDFPECDGPTRWPGLQRPIAFIGFAEARQAGNLREWWRAFVAKSQIGK